MLCEPWTYLVRGVSQPMRSAPGVEGTVEGGVVVKEALRRGVALDEQVLPLPFSNRQVRAFSSLLFRN